jgi:5'-nucleotidase
VAADRDGRRVLVVAAWEGAKVLGMLRVSFDAAGEVVSWQGTPRLVVGRRLLRLEGVQDVAGRRSRVEATRDPSGALLLAQHDGKQFAPVTDARQGAAWRDAVESLLRRLQADPAVALVDADPEGARKLEALAEGVGELRTRVVAHAEADMQRGRNRGPGPIVADSMRSKTGARIALNNPGGVRTGIAEGPVSVAQAYELLPFGNTLVTMRLTGSEVLAALEEAVDYQVSRYGADERAPYVYVSGMAFTIDLGGPRGGRIRDARVGDEAGGYSPLEASATYVVVVNSFMAEGGDRYDSFKEARDKYDTGFGDVEAFIDHISGKRLVGRREERVRVVK